MKLFSYSLAVLCLAAPLYAQTPTVFATGLQNPSKIVLTPGGKLLVTEVGQTPNSGRLSLIDSTGTRTTLIDGLPSGLAAPGNDPDGENGLALDGRKLYVAVGEGDSHVNGPTTGTIVPNPKGSSSPIFSSIITLTFNTDIDKVASSFSLKLADQFTLADYNSVTLTNSTGDQATISLLTAFRDLPDTRSIYRNSHPYSLVLMPGQSGAIYLADAGMNTVQSINTSTGRATLITRFAPTPTPLPAGPPVIEAVPTSLVPYGSHLLVSLLSGAPFAPGVSSVMDLDPATGKSTFFIPFLSSTIDTAYLTKADGSITFYALEYSLALGATPPGPGQLFFASTNGTSGVAAANLNAPSSMVIDSAAAVAYITGRADGTVLRLPLQK